MSTGSRGSKKTVWSEMDKRIRERRIEWSADELAQMEAALRGLPDLAAELDVIDLEQPALDEQAAAQRPGVPGTEAKAGGGGGRARGRA